MKKFWMVSLEGGNAPTARHATLQAAEAEAARLAYKTGNPAHILEHIITCEPKREVVWRKPELADV